MIHVLILLTGDSNAQVQTPLPLSPIIVLVCFNDSSIVTGY